MCASHIPVFVNSYISNNNNILLIKQCADSIYNSMPLLFIIKWT